MMKKKREKSLSILIKVYLAVECAIRHNQVSSSNEVGHWYSTSCPDQMTQDQNLLMPFDYSISPTLATVSVIDWFLFSAAKHTGVSKMCSKPHCPFPRSSPPHNLVSTLVPAEPPKSMTLLLTCQPHVLPKPRL